MEMDKQLLANQLQAYLMEEWGDEYDDNRDSIGIWDWVVDQEESELQGKSLELLAGEYELQM